MCQVLRQRTAEVQIAAGLRVDFEAALPQPAAVRHTSADRGMRSA